MEIIIGCFIWWVIGVVAFSWSMDWDIKGSLLLAAAIGITGPFCILEAISVKNIK